MAAPRGSVLSGHTLDKVTKAKVTIETFYSNLMNQQCEREERLTILEKSMDQEELPSEEVTQIVIKSGQACYNMSFTGAPYYIR